MGIIETHGPDNAQEKTKNEFKKVLYEDLSSYKSVDEYHCMVLTDKELEAYKELFFSLKKNEKINRAAINAYYFFFAFFIIGIGVCCLSVVPLMIFTVSEITTPSNKINVAILILWGSCLITLTVNLIASKHGVSLKRMEEMYTKAANALKVQEICLKQISNYKKDIE